MSKAEQRALELYPPKYIRETWVRTEPDVNTPLRDAYVKGFEEGYSLALDTENFLLHLHTNL
jgi:hypothetical protein